MSGVLGERLGDLERELAGRRQDQRERRALAGPLTGEPGQDRQRSRSPRRSRRTPRSMPGFHVLPIYGGAELRPQLQRPAPRRHVVVGTPGRVIDHLDRGSLDLSKLECLVLDEADEMLRMGFHRRRRDGAARRPRRRARSRCSRPPCRRQIRRIAKST